jgi:hypothetical protein
MIQFLVFLYDDDLMTPLQQAPNGHQGLCAGAYEN